MIQYKKTIGWILAIGVMIFVLQLPQLEGLPPAGQRCVALFLGVFFLYLFESIPAAVTSIAIVPLLVILSIVDIRTALAGFASTSTYLIIGSFILAEAIITSRLGDRITYLVLLVVGTTAKRISLGIVFVNIVMAFMVPSSTARTAMMLPICLNIINEFRNKSKQKTKFGANLLMTLCCTNSTISAGILTSTISNPMAVEFIQDSTGEIVSFLQWFKLGFPPALLMTFITWLLIQWIFKPEVKDLPEGKDFVLQKLEEIGPVSKEEKKSLSIIAITIFLWIFGGKWNIDSTTTCLIGAVLLCLPGIGFLKWDQCKKRISLNVVFICSGGISLGAAMSSTGAASWIAESIFQLFHLENYSTTIIIIALIIIVQFMHLVFVGTATMANVFFPIVAGIAYVSGINPLFTVLPTAFMIGGYPFIMFFNTTPNILCYDTGELNASDFPKLGILTSVVSCVVYAACVLWYWQW